MIKIIFSLTLFITFTSCSHAQIARRWFKVVPEKEAHSFSGRAQYAELNSDSFQVLVWNIKKTEMASWPMEFTLYGLGKDLLLVQEAYRNPLFDQTLSLFSGMRWDMSTSMLYRQDNNTPTGTMIVSKAEPIEAWASHTPDFEPVVNTPKANIFARYPLKNSGETLLVISVHGINITTQGAFERHMNQIRDEILKHQGPVLYAGDFNTRTKARTRYLMQQMKELNFTEVKFKHGNHRMVFLGTKNYLDHAFVRGLDVRYAEVLKYSQGSDHKPMVLELKLSPSGDAGRALASADSQTE